MNKAHLLLSSFFLLVFGVQAQPFPMSNAPITSCSGIFTDSGYSSPYTTNEDFTTVICSDAAGNSAASHIRLNFFDFELGSGDTLLLYDGDSAAAPPFDLGFLSLEGRSFSVQATAANPSGCITAVFSSDGIADGSAGWSADIACTPACQTIEAVLADSDPRPFPLDTGYLDVCPGTAVRFEAGANFPQNGLRYEQRLENLEVLWDFGDGAQDTARLTTHTYAEAGGYQVELYLFDSLGCRNSSFISQRVRVAPPPSFVWRDALDSTICANDTLRIRSAVDPNDLSADIVALTDSARFTPIGFRPDTLFLPDGLGVAYTSSIAFNQFRPGAILQRAEQLLGIFIDLEHSYARDISIDITCPDGTTLTLMDASTNLGSTNLGIPFACEPVDQNTLDPTPGIPFRYTFVNSSPANGVIDPSDRQTTSYPADPVNCPDGYSDSFLPAGEYQPINPMLALEGCPLNGTWTIRIQDNLPQDNGWLFGWGLAFSDSLYRPLERFSPSITDFGWYPHPTTVSSSANELSASPPQAGDVAYTFWVEDDFGCVNDTTLRFAVLPPTHPECGACELDFGDQADVIICPDTPVELDLRPDQALEQCVGFQEYPTRSYLGRFGPAVRDTHRLWVNSLQPASLDDVLDQICSVCVDLPASQTAGLRLDLVAPDGTTLTLANGLVGNTGYTGTCFTPTALQAIVAANGNYNGSFQPQQDWAALQGVPLNGEWLLVITNSLGAGQEASLDEWSISFTQRNSYTYSWTPTSTLSGDLTGPVVTAEPDGSTTYVLTATDLYGCTDQDTVQLDVLTELPPPEIRCSENGPELRFDWDPLPGIANYQYRLIRAGDTTAWSVPGPTTFVVVDELANGDQVTIEVRADLSGLGLDCTVTAGTLSCTSSFCGLAAEVASIIDNSCAGGMEGSATIRILSGSRPVQTSLDGQAFTADTTFRNLTTGPYAVEIIDALGCSFNLSFRIDAPDTISLSPVQTFAACFGSPTNEAAVSFAGGSGQGYQIQWNDPNQQTGPVATNLAAGPVTVSVSDDAGCTNSATLQVSNLDSISFNFLASPPTCAGDNDGGVGINQISGGSGLQASDYSFRWSNGATTIVQTDVPGGLSYTVTVTDQQGCSNARSRFLPDGRAIPLGAPLLSPPACRGDSNGSIAFPNLSTPNYSFIWNEAANNQSSNPATDLAAGIYRVTIVDENLGCRTDTSLTLLDPEPLRVILAANDNPCFGYRQGSIQAEVSGGVPDYQYSWSTGSTTADISGLPAGDYSLVLSDANNCMVTASTTVGEPTGLTASASAEAVSCFGDNDGLVNIAVAGGSPPFRYSLDGNNFTSSPTLIGLAAGNYTAYIEDVNDCVFTTPVQVASPPALELDAGADQRIVFGDSVQLFPLVNGAQGMISYQWFPPYSGILSCTTCPSPFAGPDITADYELVVRDENGCMDTDFVRVFVDKPRLVAVPSGFTPNGDAVNSELIVHGRPGTEILRFQVYDRWGELVFERADFLVNDRNAVDNWDGTFRGEEAMAGIYLWILEVRYEDGSTEVLRGQTTLIR